MGINIDMTPNNEENMDLFSKAVKKSHDKKMRRKVKKMKKEEVNPYPKQRNIERILEHPKHEIVLCGNGKYKEHDLCNQKLSITGNKISIQPSPVTNIQVEDKQRR